MDPQVNLLFNAVAQAYKGVGAFALRFAKGKLRYDPVFFFLLQRGLLPNRGSLLDLGCGRGVLLSLLQVAKSRFQAGVWPQGWPPPPLHLALRGVELDPRRVAVAQGALATQAEVVQQDVRDVDLPRCSVVVLFDVLLYLEARDQSRVLERAAAAIEPGGLLLLREADAAAGFTFKVTRWSGRLLEVLQFRLRDRLHYRSAADWSGLLRALGFTVVAEPMSAGTPFANILFVCKKRDRG